MWGVCGVGGQKFRAKCANLNIMAQGDSLFLADYMAALSILNIITVWVWRYHTPLTRTEITSAEEETHNGHEVCIGGCGLSG